MKIDQLRIFLAVAEHLHFTRAADALYITQPAVSAAIQLLEERYGVKLFHRIGRHIELTDAGNLLQIEAQKILDQIELAEQGLRELNNLQRGELKLGCSLTIGNYWLPQKISLFKQKYPGISINCTLANAEDILTGITNGFFDAGLVTGEASAAKNPTLEIQCLEHEIVSIVVGKNHPWFAQGQVSVTGLTDTVWIMREPGSGSRQMFEQSIKNWGIDPGALDIALVLTTSEMIKAVVAGGLGAAALPRSVVKLELKLGVLKEVNVVDKTAQKAVNHQMNQPVILLRNKKRFKTKIAHSFEQTLLSFSEEND